ncbi:MAG: YraN family protein, partial [Pseudomonadota bacterium]
RAAETIAAERYRALGGSILEQRARTAGGEIDLVVRLGDTIVFVEVKARRRLADAVEAVDGRGQARLSRAAAAWLAERAATAAEMRLDVAAVGGDGGLEIFEDAIWG